MVNEDEEKKKGDPDFVPRSNRESTKLLVHTAANRVAEMIPWTHNQVPEPSLIRAAVCCMFGIPRRCEHDRAHQRWSHTFTLLGRRRRSSVIRCSAAYTTLTQKVA